MVMTKTSPPERPVRLPELLAPAGSPEALRAAVAAGADAVYLSGKRFGARKFAANFSEKQIEEAVRFAHTRGVRVYVTVNTLIHDRELDTVLEYLIWLYATGVDAVLVQDAGLAALAREFVPGLVLHASTQMTIHNAAGVRWAASQGLSRVVLARELSLGEVQAIAEETAGTGVGLEVFAHGALCYGYSGQCLLSSAIGGRSGNRGMCAQPCRKEWTILTGTPDAYGRPQDAVEVALKDRYLLSPKDLCTYRALPAIVRSPVVSLKIEGRMKSPEYVAIVVSTYRRALDAIAAGTFVPSAEDERDLILAFNRGFTKGYLSGDRHRNLMGRDAPDNRGLYIGIITAYDGKRSVAIIRPVKEALVPEPGDGLLIRHPEGAGETGFALNTGVARARGELVVRVPRPVPAGSTVFMTSSRALDARARQIMQQTADDLGRKIPLDLKTAISAEGVLSVSGAIGRPDGTIIPLACRPEVALQPADTRPLTAGTIAGQLEKCGGTPFSVRSLAMADPGNRFAPLSEINRLRRELVATAEEQLVASYRPPVSEVRRAQHHWQERVNGHAPAGGKADKRAGSAPSLGVIVDTPEAVQEAAAAGAGTIYYEPHLTQPPQTCGGQAPFVPAADLVTGALKAAAAYDVPLVLKLPLITHDRYLQEILPALTGPAGEGLAGVMTDHAGAATAVREALPSVPITGGPGLNIFNHAAVAAMHPLFTRVTLSSELSRDEIARLMDAVPPGRPGPDCALVVGGTRGILVTEDCIRTLVMSCRQKGADCDDKTAFSLRDDHGTVYPLFTGDECRTVIGDAAELCLIEYLPFFRTAGIREVIVDARHRPARYAGTATGIWRRALDQLAASPGAPDRAPFLTACRDELRRISRGGLSTGHFQKGLRE